MKEVSKLLFILCLCLFYVFWVIFKLLVNLFHIQIKLIQQLFIIICQFVALCIKLFNFSFSISNPYLSVWNIQKLEENVSYLLKCNHSWLIELSCLKVTFKLWVLVEVIKPWGIGKVLLSIHRFLWFFIDNFIKLFLLGNYLINLCLEMVYLGLNIICYLSSIILFIYQSLIEFLHHFHYISSQMRSSLLLVFWFAELWDSWDIFLNVKWESRDDRRNVVPFTSIILEWLILKRVYNVWIFPFVD